MPLSAQGQEELDNNNNNNVYFRKVMGALCKTPLFTRNKHKKYSIQYLIEIVFNISGK